MTATNLILFELRLDTTGSDAIGGAESREHLVTKQIISRLKAGDSLAVHLAVPSAFNGAQ